MIVYDGSLKNGSFIHVEAVSERTFRVRIYDRYDKESGMNRYGLILPQPDPEVKTLDEGDALTMVTAQAKLTISKATGELSLNDKDGRVLLSSLNAPLCGHDGWQAAFSLNAGEHIYGLGDVTRERIEKTGFATEMWVKNVKSYIPIPFMTSTAGWGLYLNTTWRHSIDVGHAQPGELRLSGQGGGLDLYLFAGADFETLINEYTNLTGKPAMLPAWAYGLVYVCNQDVNASEMMQECLNFRREDIPCDVCGLEPGWMSQRYDFSTEKAWNTQKFNIPYWAPKGEATFFGAMNRLGFKLSLWLCCDYDLSFEEERRLSAARKAQADDAPDADNFEQDTHFESRGKLSMDHITKVDEGWLSTLKSSSIRAHAASSWTAPIRSLSIPTANGATAWTMRKCTTSIPCSTTSR